MRLPRFFPGVLAAALSVAYIGGAATHALAPIGDPLATTVTGACFGGPGRMSVAVKPTAGGRYRVEAIARGLDDGSPWRVLVYQLGQVEVSDREFRPVVVDGGWTVVTRFPAPTAPDDVFFAVYAGELGGDDPNRGCSVLQRPASPAAGLGECNKRPEVDLAPRSEIELVAYEQDDGSTLVRSFVSNVRTGSRWHLKLTATDAARRQVVAFDDRAGRRGAELDTVRSRVVLSGIQDPRLRMVASNEEQGRCFLRLDPRNAATDTPLTLRRLGRLTAFHHV